MNILFVHNNFPGQFSGLAGALAKKAGFRVAAIGSSSARASKGINLLRYRVPDPNSVATHPFARRFDLECRRAEEVLYACSTLRARGFSPDVILAHPGWGEAMPLSAVFENAKIVAYCEYYYNTTNSDIDFDPEFPEYGVDSKTAVHMRNAATLLSMVQAHRLVSPTEWQQKSFPESLRPTIDVVHDGIDVNRVRPDRSAAVKLPSGGELTAKHEVLTFVARNLEPYRGYHIFMRSLPKVLAARPHAQVLIVGGAGVSYGRRPITSSWKECYYDEVKDRLDPSRIHFLGRLPYDKYLKVLQISRCHVYLTYPFVLSWSLLEAMSAGCTVIASDTGPVTEIISHSKNGILVPFFDEQMLSDRIIDVLSDPKAYTAIGENARMTIQDRYDFDTTCLPQWLSIIGSP